MSSAIRIGIIGDYDGRPSHVATEAALKHCATRLGIPHVASWLPTIELEQITDNSIGSFDGLWCAPGSPYQSMWGAMNAIRYARENDIPFIGTCGGFQHAALEFAKNVIQVKELCDKDFDPYSPNLFISALSCSLLAQTKHIILSRNSKLFDIYHNIDIEERYNCNFGLNKEFQNMIEKKGFLVAGVDEEGEARILLLDGKRFYIATLFQPQLSSSSENPHPLILEFMTSTVEYHNKLNR